MTNDADEQYLATLRTLTPGNPQGLHGYYGGCNFREGRNGGTHSRFGTQLRFDLSKGFPLLTTKRVHMKAIIVELLWFLRGGTNIRWLQDHNVRIWDEWADENGDLGPVYGSQWRNWPRYHTYPGGEVWKMETPFDQIANVIKSIREQPYGRRHIVTAWNPAEVDDMALPPCHVMFQFYVSNDGKLSCHLYQRSADWFLGVPFNIASYALLTQLIARECYLDVGDFVHSFGDYHLYHNHVEQATLQLSREPMRHLPKVEVDYAPGQTLFDLEPAQFQLVGYASHPKIDAEVSK